MNSELTLHQAAASDAPEVAVLVGELLAEIMNAIGTQAFNFLRHCRSSTGPWLSTNARDLPSAAAAN